MPNHDNTDAPAKNGLGFAGFILSCLGIFSCGLASVPGFLLSLYAVFKEPRGYAIAGIILGLPGAICFGTVGLGFILVAIGAGGLAFAVDHVASLNNAFNDAETRVRAAYVEDAKVTTKELLVVVKGIEDPWAQQMFVSRTGQSFILVSGGNDDKVGIEDDITREFQLKNYHPSKYKDGKEPNWSLAVYV
ncbi:MAG: hypothetical protein ACI97A_002946 [Planctomycetota bacterium]|jgi:hypothetical protein